MDPLWIALAFAFGFLAKQARLPPLVGYLAAGFILHLLGFEGGIVIEEVSDLGVLLLLFGIGLKLRPRRLLKPEVWAGTTLHMGITVVLFGGAIYGLTAAGFSLFGSLESLEWLLLAFMLSFSSTVFAVKVLEEKGEMSSLHGRVAIGVLIMQDIVAILFMTFSTGKFPSPWALSLLGLVLVRPVLMAVLNRASHGELLLLFGLLLTVGGAVLFDAVGLKADLGALILGVIVASHPKAEELSNAILGLKDLLLVGFFLSIGLIGVPDLQGLGIASLLVMALPLKVLLFFWLFTRFRLRARTAALSSLGLANYSEFGLIVGSLALSKGWIGEEWLVIFALALALSFAGAAPLNRVQRAIARGVSVYQGNIEEALSDYPDGTFDYVILSQTLQETSRPLRVLREMLRVGTQAVVAFPNFGHWSVRLAHLFSGRAPKTKLFPYDWYDSPNIHFLTVRDFEDLATRQGWIVERKIYIAGHHTGEWLPNLMAEVAVFVVRT